MPYRIDWKSTSQWVGTETTSFEGDEVYTTREEAESALAEMQNDSDLMQAVHDAAVESQGVEGWIEIVEDD